MIFEKLEFFSHPSIIGLRIKIVQCHSQALVLFVIIKVIALGVIFTHCRTYAIQKYYSRVVFLAVLLFLWLHHDFTERYTDRRQLYIHAPVYSGFQRNRFCTITHYRQFKAIGT